MERSIGLILRQGDKLGGILHAALLSLLLLAVNVGIVEHEKECQQREVDVNLERGSQVKVRHGLELENEAAQLAWRMQSVGETPLITALAGAPFSGKTELVRTAVSLLNSNEPRARTLLQSSSSSSVRTEASRSRIRSPGGVLYWQISGRTLVSRHLFRVLGLRESGQASIWATLRHGIGLPRIWQYTPIDEENIFTLEFVLYEVLAKHARIYRDRTHQPLLVVVDDAENLLDTDESGRPRETHLFDSVARAAKVMASRGEAAFFFVIDQDGAAFQRLQLKQDSVLSVWNLPVELPERHAVRKLDETLPNSVPANQLYEKVTSGRLEALLRVEQIAKVGFGTNQATLEDAFLQTTRAYRKARFCGLLGKESKTRWQLLSSALENFPLPVRHFQAASEDIANPLLRCRLIRSHSEGFILADRHLAAYLVKQTNSNPLHHESPHHYHDKRRHLYED